MDLKNNQFTKFTMLVVGAVTLYWGLNHYNIIFDGVKLVFGFLFPFVLGAGIAFLINIPLRFMELQMVRVCPAAKEQKKQKVMRGISILLTLTLIIAVILAVMLIVVPQIGQTVGSIKDEIPGFIEGSKSTIAQLERDLPDLKTWMDAWGWNLDDIGKEITGFISALGGKALNSSLSFATSVFSGIFNFCLAIVFAIYILASKENLKVQTNGAIDAYCSQKTAKKIRSVVQLTDKTFSGFFTGQCLEAIILGGLFFAGMSLLRFPYALLISVLIGFTALIPVFGAFIGCGVGAFLILVVNPMQAVWFVVFFLVMQQLEGNLIYPKVMGSSVGLPPMWVFLAVTLGGSMFGVLGMLLFIPITSILYTLIGADIKQRLGRKTRSETKPETRQEIKQEIK